MNVDAPDYIRANLVVYDGALSPARSDGVLLTPRAHRVQPSASAVSESLNELKHNPGISLDWTAEEESLLEKLLSSYASYSNLVRYAKIAVQLKGKSVRDVALRCKWMDKRGSHNEQKENPLRKKKRDRMDNADNTSANSVSPSIAHLSCQQGLPSCPLTFNDEMPPDGIGGVANDLLFQNYELLSQISKNLETSQIYGNDHLFHRLWDNINSLMDESMKNLPEIMQKMPPIPIKLNEQLAEAILCAKP